MRDLLVRRAERAGRWGAMPGSVLAPSGAPWQVVTAGHGTAVGRQSRGGTSTARSGTAAGPDASSMRRLCRLRALAGTEQTAIMSPARRRTGLRSCRADPLEVVSPGPSCTRRAEAVSHVAFGAPFGTVARGWGRGARRSVPSGFGDRAWETEPLRLNRATRRKLAKSDPRLIRRPSAPGGTVSPDALAKPEGTPSATPQPLPGGSVPKCFANGLCETRVRASIPTVRPLGTRDALPRSVARPGPTWRPPRIP